MLTVEFTFSPLPPGMPAAPLSPGRPPGPDAPAVPGAPTTPGSPLNQTHGKSIISVAKEENEEQGLDGFQSKCLIASICACLATKRKAIEKQEDGLGGVTKDA